jgi:chromosome segregation ATPase
MAQQLEIAWDSTALSIAPTESASTYRQPSVRESDVAGPEAIVPEAPVLQPEQESSSYAADEQGSASLMPLVVELLDQTPHQATDPSGVVSEQQRVKQLEQALYQCQLYITELKQKLAEQEFLEEQLAATESFSHIQKQAIETLKAQATEQQALQSELAILREQVQTQSSQTEEMARQQEHKLATLQQQLRQEQATVDRLTDKNAQLSAQLDALQGTMVQETQQRIIAQKTAERLRLELRNRDGAMRSLESKLERSAGMLTNREEMIAALKELNRPDSQKDQFIQGLSSTLLKAQRQIIELEDEVSSQSIVQAQLQHTTHELEQEGKVTQERSDQLEQQVHDLQEQVLRQAQQASEFETAVQHWKNRSQEAESWTTRLAQLGEHLDDASPADNLSPEFKQTLRALMQWAQGTHGNITTGEIQPLSPKGTIGARWQKL